MTQVEISGMVAGIISIVVGVLVIAWPRIIAYIIGVYLIILGIIAVVAALR
jgi:uncharacterized membrane protein HdeD (DUF308 family)